VGEPIRWSVSVDKETDAIAEILQRTYAEYVGSNRSRLVQFLFKRFHRMAGNLPAALEHEQGINQAILSQEITTLNNLSQEFPVPQAGQRKPPVRASRVPLIGGGRLTALVAAHVWGSDGHVYLHFRARFRPFKSNSFRQVA
jgi:hypothetical protein